MSGISLITRTVYSTGRRAGLPVAVRRAPTARRLLREAQLCQHGARLTTATIVRLFGVGRATAKRDLALLREYGFL